MKTIIFLTILISVNFSKCIAGWSSQTWNSLAIARTGTSGFTIGNVIYLGTGQTNTGGVLKDFYKLENGVWTQLADFPIQMYGGVGFSIGNKGYIGTGNWFNNLYTNFYQYDTLADTWTVVTSIPGPGRFYASSFVIDGKAYVGSGE